MTRLKLLALLIASATTFSGCATFGQRVVKIHLIEKSDIVSMPKGVAYTPEKNGWFLSDHALNEVENAKVSNAKKGS